jgi:hypothetical protein
MISDPEKRLIEALKTVDAHGDVAPPHVHDAMTMVLRGNAIQAHLVHWDDPRGRYALTGAGRRRISASGRGSGTIRSFRTHGVLAAACSTGNLASCNSPCGCFPARSVLQATALASSSVEAPMWRRSSCAEPSSARGQRFESPQLHQVVAANGPGFPTPTIRRQFSALARRLMVCGAYSAVTTGLWRRTRK